VVVEGPGRCCAYGFPDAPLELRLESRAGLCVGGGG